MLTGYLNSMWPSFIEIFIEEQSLLDGWILICLFSSETLSVASTALPGTRTNVNIILFMCDVCSIKEGCWLHI